MMLTVASLKGSRGSTAGKSRRTKSRKFYTKKSDKEENKKGNSYLFHKVAMPSIRSLILYFLLIFLMTVGTRFLFSYINYQKIEQSLEIQKKLNILTRGIRMNYISFANIFVYNHLLRYNDSELKLKVEESIEDVRDTIGDQFKVVFDNNNPNIGTKEIESGIFSISTQNQDFDLMMTENFCSVLTFLQSEEKAVCVDLTVSSSNANLKVIKTYLGEYVENMLKSNENFTKISYLFSVDEKNNEEILEFLQRAVTNLFKSNLDIINSHLTTIKSSSLLNAILSGLIILGILIFFSVKMY